jgi:small subunit ribosomal protein S9
MSSIVKEKIIEVNNSAEVVNREPKLDEKGRSYATGKRKNAAARVWLKKGSGKISINGKEAKPYLGREILFNIAVAPLAVAEGHEKFDIVTTVSGGGKSGQAGAIAHGLAKALDNLNPSTHRALRDGGFLTRDSRVVERKKYGLKKARKAQTYRKR